MSSCSQCFSEYNQDDALVIEGFEDYSAGIFNDNNNPRYNYLMAMNAIYNPGELYNGLYGAPLYEYFKPEYDADVQQQLFQIGDYNDYYHNLFNNV